MNQTEVSIDSVLENGSPFANTKEAAAFLRRKPQTLRAWACEQKGPIRPRNINGRLAWRWKDLHELAGGA